MSVENKNLGLYEMRVPVTAKKVNKVRVLQDEFGNEYPINEEMIIVTLSNGFEMRIAESMFKEMFKKVVGG
ncbi:MAG: hypothetical protein MR639_05925 [Clostridium sp.]|nr:hypothetical protein [Clostridium sp.]MDY5098621.1 hypothetical protein [Clostridium sp.]